MQVSKWGNSLAVRLPAALVETLKLKDGDDIEIAVASKKRFEVSKKMSVEETLAGLRKFRGRLSTGFKFNREEANSRGDPPREWEK